MKTDSAIRIAVPPSIGSSGAIRAVADGAIDVGLVTRPLTEAEKRLGLTAYAESYKTRRWTILLSAQEMNRMLASTRFAVRITDLASMTTERLAVKPLKVNSVLPLPVNVQNGRYPLVRTFSFVFRGGDVRPGARAFVDFVLSPAGVKLIRANGSLGEGSRNAGP
jgi:ABC-type phosphate transport system substrate-binding protein